LIVLGWTGYVANAPSQAPAALTGIRVMTGPIPAIFLLVGILFAWLYPLDRRKFEELRAELAERRATTDEKVEAGDDSLTAHI